MILLLAVKGVTIGTKTFASLYDGVSFAESKGLKRGSISHWFMHFGQTI